MLYSLIKETGHGRPKSKSTNKKNYEIIPTPSPPPYQRNLGIAKLPFYYPLSSARTIVENGFGILVRPFIIFYTKIFLQGANSTKIALYCLCIE